MARAEPAHSLSLPNSIQPSERARQIEAEQVALLYAQGLSSQVVALLDTGLVTLVLWEVAPRADVTNRLDVLRKPSLDDDHRFRGRYSGRANG